MIRPPPISTRTYTLFPYPTLVRSGLLRRKLPHQTLGFGAVGARRVPAPLFLAGHWVAAFVDHDVEPAAPLGDVSVHEVSSIIKRFRWSEPGGTRGRRPPLRGAHESSPRVSPGGPHFTAMEDAWERVVVVRGISPAARALDAKIGRAHV